MLHFIPGPISDEEANYLVKDRPSHELYFDYVKGRVMKVNLAGDSFDSYGYDRDNGHGAAKRVIDMMR